MGTIRTPFSQAVGTATNLVAAPQAGQPALQPAAVAVNQNQLQIVS